jgi:hypothetical protein
VASGVTLRLLLDQNFPKPPGFDLAAVDATVEAIHVFDHDASLTAAGVPDWLIYLRAAHDGFDAVVTRDWHQLDQPEELWVLANLQITVVSWRKPFSDPVAEWGHLLAYMPQLKRRIERRQPRVLLLPPPQLSTGNEVNPRDALGKYANRQRRAVGEVLEEARAAVRDYLNLTDRPDLYARLERARRADHRSA